MALWQGLNQAIKHGIQTLSVVGDSRLVIHSLNTMNLPPSIHLHQILRRTFLLLPLFQDIKFYHVMRKNNEQADIAANEAITLGKGTLKVNNEQNLVAIP